MKTYKINTTAILIASVMYISGCNNDMVSTMSTTETGISETNTAEQDRIKVNSKFKASIKLESHQRYSFDYGNTGLRFFRSISILNCEQFNNDIEIYGYMDDERILLDCNSSNFEVFSIEIRNLTSNTINLEVTLLGAGRIPSINYFQ